MAARLILLSALVACALAAPAPASKVHPVWTYGHAAYTYGPLHCTGSPCDVVPSCNKAHWITDIENFNKDTTVSNASISTVYSYGGDVEFWPKKESAQACWAPATDDCNYTSYYDVNNKKAADVYAQAEGVNQVVALLDARLDGWNMIEQYNHNDACNFGDFYPNLNNLTDTQLGKLAQQTAQLFCQDDNLGGIQVDLEPYQDPYKESLETFLKAMVSEFEDKDGSNGCRTDTHPGGRTTSYFTFAHRTRDDFYETLMGENGYFVFSGYDLKPKNLAFEYNTVEEFGANLLSEIPEIRRVAKNPNAKFTMAVPIAASCHEYEHYVPMHGDGCGPACQPYDSGATMAEYVQKLMDILTASENIDLFTVKDGGQFVGLSFWVWTYDMTYPPMKWFNNLFLPATPSSDVLSILKKELPKLDGGYTR
jgi:hypothetical protein